MRSVRKAAAFTMSALSLMIVACGPRTPTPTPQPTASPTATRTATRPPTPTRTPLPPSPTPPPVPSEAGAFAAYVADTYRTLGGIDLAVRDAQWLGIEPPFLVVELTRDITSELADVDWPTAVKWAARLARDMETFTGGGEWFVRYEYRWLETNPFRAGELLATADEWLSVSDEYDVDAEGFWVTKDPIHISKMLLDSTYTVLVGVFPTSHSMSVDILWRQLR